MSKQIPSLKRALYPVIAGLGWFAGSCGAAPLNLAREGKSDYVIALAQDAIPAEKTAARQLQKYMEEISGARLEIQSEKDVPPGAKQILIGPGERVKALMPTQKWEELGHDGIVIKAVDGSLILAGGRPRGTLYSVFQFLEDSAGCKWWTPTEQSIPKNKDLSLEIKEAIYRPVFDYRENFTTEIIQNPIFSVIMRDNGGHAMKYQKPPGEAWGGHYTILGGAHTWAYLLPIAKYFKDHPEWYADPANANKPCTAASPMPAPELTQLCLSNPAVVEELSINALAWIKENPEAGYISISENDNGAYCKCEACEALAKEEGSQAGPIINFVNQVAANIAKEYPNFKVETLAYRGGVKAPKTIKPAGNVLIRLAPLQADFGHPMDSSWNGGHWLVKENVRDGLREWSAISGQLFMWNYVTNYLYTILPFPNWEGLGKDLRFFAANNVKGVFQQGDTFTNGVGDMLPLRTWLVSKLLWDPTQDEKALIHEFLTGYYGPAAPYLEKYIALIQTSFLKLERPLSSHTSEFDFLSLDTMNEATRLFDAALVAVQDDPILSQRVRRERLSIDMAWLYRARALKKVATATGKEFLGPQDPYREVFVFDESARYYGVGEYGEKRDYREEIERLKMLHLPSTPLPAAIFGKLREGVNVEKDVIDTRPLDWHLIQLGKWITVVDDPNATNKRAARVVGSVKDWAIQYNLINYSPELFGQERWRVFVLARVETTGKEPESKAVQMGLWGRGKDGAPGTGQLLLLDKTVADVADGQYQLFDLGAHEISADAYVYVAPVDNPNVTAIFVDRIVLIRESALKAP